MRKLSLNIDDLQVESFSPESALPGQRGTLQGYAATQGCGYSYGEECTHTDPYFCFGPSGGGSCVGASCDHWADTCGGDGCAFSDMTNCHRC